MTFLFQIKDITGSFLSNWEKDLSMLILQSFGGK